MTALGFNGDSFLTFSTSLTKSCCESVFVLYLLIFLDLRKSEGPGSVLTGSSTGSTGLCS